MASASFHICCLIWSVLCCSQVYALEAGKVAFVRHACQYGYDFIQAQYTLKDECKRATCYISDRKLTIEECAATASDNSSCSVKSDFKELPFPFCCESRKCREKSTIINGIITHYGTKGAADHARYLEPTERWSAPMKYILGACKNGQCRYRKQRVVHETKLTTPCVSVRTYEGKDYIGVEECPTFPEGDRNCVKLNDGNPNNRYPYCCPEYMCPPKGRERRNTTHIEKAVMHKGMCKYGGNAFAHDFSTLEPCRTAVCDVQRRWVTVMTCLDDEDLNWTRCKAVNPVIRRYGNHPVCCPDYMCPDMKVDRLPEPKTFKTEYKIADWAMERAEEIERDNVLPEGRTYQVNAVPGEKYVWPGAIIPYTIDPGIEKLYETIRKAMDAVESGTCLRFVKRTNEKDYIRIFKGKGCSSLVGRRGGAQPVSLGEGCSNVTLIEHELLHAAGFFHEHMRPDRDQYITIFKENIDPKYYSEFQKLHLGPHDNLVPFDTDSVMLYGGHAFAREPGLTTMTAKDGTVLIPIYNKTGLSDTDILSVNILYNCPN